MSAGELHSGYKNIICGFKWYLRLRIGLGPVLYGLASPIEAQLDITRWKFTTL